MALVGPNGAGKSTLFRMILGEDTPDEGSISMDEYAIVGYLPQEASEPKDETVLEIALSITPEMEQAIHTIRTAENANKTDTPEYAEAIDTFNAANGYQLEPKAKKILKGLAFRESDFHRPAREMSGGWIMRAYLAKLLVLEPGPPDAGRTYQPPGPPVPAVAPAIPEKLPRSHPDDFPRPGFHG